MKFLIHNDLDGRTTEASVRPSVVVSPGPNRIEVCVEAEEIAELRVDGIPRDTLSSVTAEFPASKSLLTISGRTADGSYFATEFVNEAFRQLNQELLRDVADFHARLKRLSERGSVRYGDLAAALDSGKISLLVRPHVITDLQADHHLSRIIEALPALQQVAHDPRRHLRIDEAVRPVFVVRRTGPAALRHLSQHSEHWQSRTVGGLRPARLLAKIIDDDLDLYENRFVVTLIKQIHRRMAKLAVFVDTGMTQAQSAFDIECYAEELMDPQARRMLTALLPSLTDNELLSSLDLFDGLTRKVETILHVLADCEETLLFRSLRRLSPVQAPILPTNILTMDPHYRTLFNLWHELDRLVPEEEGTGELPGDIGFGYTSFCGVLVIAALRHSGFRPEDGDHQLCIKTQNGHVVPCGTFVRGEWRVEVETADHSYVSAVKLGFRRRMQSSYKLPPGMPVPPINNSQLRRVVTISGTQLELLDTPTEGEARQIGELWYVATREEQNRKRRSKEDIGVKWKSFIDDVLRRLPHPESFSIAILPVLSSAGVDPRDASRNSEFYLNMAAHATGNFSLGIVALPSGCRDVLATTATSIIRRLLNYGDSFFEADSTEWAQRAGILQLSPWTLTSLHRVNRLIETSILNREIKAERLADICPICESRHIVAAQQEEFSRECRQCNTLWGTNRCKWCSRPFPWLRLRRKPWNQSSGELPYPRWIEKLELAAGTKAFPSFCESSESTPAAVPICPYCGRCARKDKIQNCPRCCSAGVSGVSAINTVT